MVGRRRGTRPGPPPGPPPREGRPRFLAIFLDQKRVLFLRFFWGGGGWEINQALIRGGPGPGSRLLASPIRQDQLVLLGGRPAAQLPCKNSEKQWIRNENDEIWLAEGAGPLPDPPPDPRPGKAGLDFLAIFSL